MVLPVGSRLAISVATLWRAQACRDAALRHNRVSPLGAERGQDQLSVSRRGARPRRRSAGWPDVILVVRARHGAVSPAPRPTAVSMALRLTRRRSARPLERPESGMGTEEGLTERTTPAPRSSGHRCTSTWKASPYPIRRASVQAGCGEVGWTEPRLASSERENSKKISSDHGYRRGGEM